MASLTSPSTLAKPDPAAIAAALAAPFAASEVRWKPASVSGNRALAIAYVDSRCIMDRLDAVLGILGWQDSYKVLPDGSVVCRLKCLVAGGWVAKTDVGGESEQKDHGDRTKAAFSDALKRAAVKFGIGRYLYRLPSQWCDYDPAKRQFVKQPALPRWALPHDVAPGIGAPGVEKLLALAQAKGAKLSDYLEPLAGKFGRFEEVSAEQARGVWIRLQALPDTANGNGKAVAS